jgi:hypothetical protein
MPGVKTGPEMNRTAVVLEELLVNVLVEAMRGDSGRKEGR